MEYMGKFIQFDNHDRYEEDAEKYPVELLVSTPQFI